MATTEPPAARSPFGRFPRTTALAATLTVALLGCATSAGPPPDKGPTTTVEHDTAAGAPSASPDDAPATPRQAASCHPQCAAWLGQARGLMGKAQGLGDAPNVALLFGQAGDGFARAWRGCDFREPVAEDLACEGAPGAVAEMARAYEAAQRPDGRILAALVALDPRWKRAAAEVGAGEASLTTLADEAEKAAADDPKGPHAAKMMSAAVYARIAAGDLRGAESAARQFRQRFAAKEPDETPMQAAAIALAAGAAGDWPGALRVLGSFGPPPPKAHERAALVWHSARGRALEATGKLAQASAEHDRVLAIWDGAAASDRASFVGHANPGPMIDRERVVEAVGEAYLHQGRKALARARALDLPPYRGAATVVGVNEFVQGPVAAWIGERQARLREAEAQFGKVRAIRPVPPPTALAAALYEMGGAFADFADAFDRAPAPKHVAGDAELGTAWRGALDAAAGQMRANATAKLEACVATARKLALEAQGRECTERLDAVRSAASR